MADWKKQKEAILNEIGLSLLSEYEDKNLRASGRFEQKTRVENQSGDPVLIIPRYTKFIIDGIGSKGGYNPRALTEWIRNKGILARDPKTGRFQTFSQTAFAIANKIKNYGTDIHQGKRQGIELEKAIETGLNKKFPELVQIIIKQIMDHFGKKDIEIKL